MKRSILLIASLLLLVSIALSACGSSKDEGAASDSPAVTQPAAGGEKVKLTMGSWRVEDVAGYKKIIAEFNKQYPNIEIDFKPTADGEYNTVLNTSLQTGSGPDIIHLRPYAPGIQLGEQGFIEPINTLKGLDIFTKDQLAASTDKAGKTYGVPIAMNATQIFYNKTIFAKYNLQEPKTWEELMAIAETLKKNKIVPFALGSKEGWLLSLTHSAIGPRFYGGIPFADQLLTGEKNFKSPEFVKSIQAMKDLVPYLPSNFVGLGMDDMRNLFVTEQAGMFIMGDWEIAVMQQMNPDLKFDTFPIPGVDGGKPTVTTWVDGSFGVNAKSPHKAEALKFIEFATTKEFGTLMANELKRASTVPGVVPNDPIAAKIAKNAADYSNPYMILIHFDQGNPTLKTALQDSIQGMYLNALTPEKAAEKIQANADTWFKPAK